MILFYDDNDIDIINNNHIQFIKTNQTKSFSLLIKKLFFLILVSLVQNETNKNINSNNNHNNCNNNSKNQNNCF